MKDDKICEFMWWNFCFRIQVAVGLGSCAFHHYRFAFKSVYCFFVWLIWWSVNRMVCSFAQLRCHHYIVCRLRPHKYISEIANNRLAEASNNKWTKWKNSIAFHRQTSYPLEFAFSAIESRYYSMNRWFFNVTVPSIVLPNQIDKYLLNRTHAP